MWTKLPSFIVTLGTFFVLQGVNLAVTKILIDQVSVVGLAARRRLLRRQADLRLVRQDRHGLAAVAGGRRGEDHAHALRRHVLCFVGVTAVATWVLLRTRAGNWIFAVGGAQQSARQVGVPGPQDQGRSLHDHRLRRAGWSGMLSLFKTTTAQSTTGVGQEFVFIICAVVGGCLLTGGYGSAIGAAFGALIYGMVQQGIPQRGLGQRLAVRLPRRAAARRRAGQQLGQDTSGGHEMTTTDDHTLNQAELPTTGHRADRGTRHRQDVRLGDRAARRHDDSQRRGGHLRPGRQRCRQVDVHQDPRRCSRAHQRRLRRRRHQAALLLAACGAEPRNRDGVPGPGSRPADAGLAELLPGVRADQGLSVR